MTDSHPIIDVLLAEYLQRVDSDQPVDREEFLRQHPEHADELRELIEADEALSRATGTRTHFVAPPNSSSDTSLPPDPALGTIIRYLGDYELLEEIARGGMGVVFKARQVSLNRVLALKMIRGGELASQDEIERFRHEAESAAALQHPGIVAVHEIGQHDGHHYFSMDLIDGRSLAERIIEHPLPPRKAVEYVRQVAEALEYAHRQGTLHRDIKPSNIIIDRNGKAHVTDFGLAKRVEVDSDLTLSGQILGTPSYMSPEQAIGNRALMGPPCDVYALGAVLYALLTGRPPFSAATPAETIRQVLAADPVSPRVLNPSIPRDLETICLKCLAKEIPNRYPTAQHLADELQRWLNGEPIYARPIPILSRIIRWCRRNRLVAGLVVAVSVSIVAGTLLSTFFGIEAANLATEVADERAELNQLSESAEGLREDVADLQAEKKTLEAANHDAVRQLTSIQQQADALVYARQLETADREWNAGNTKLAWEALYATPIERRGWEYRFLSARFQQHQQALGRHQKNVLSVDLNPDASMAVSAGADHNVIVWDVKSGKLLQKLKGHRGYVHTVAFSPDGKHIASGSFDGAVIVWDCETWKRKTTFKKHRFQVLTLAFSPNSEKIVSAGRDQMKSNPPGTDSNAIVWDIESEKIDFKLKGHTDPIWRVAWSRDGRRIATASRDHTARTWDAKTGAPIQVFSGHGDRYGVMSIAFSPDSRWVASGGDDGDGTIHIWDVDSGEERMTLSRPGPLPVVWDLEFSDDGQQLVSCGGDTMIRKWDLQSRQLTMTLQGHVDAVTSIAFDEISGIALSGSLDKTVKIWRPVVPQEPTALAGHGGAVPGIAFRPDGNRIVTAGGHSYQAPEINLWDADAGRQLGSLDGRGQMHGSLDAAWSLDSARIATAGAPHINLYDGRTAVLIKQISAHGGLYTQDLDFSPDGKYLASCSADQKVKLWDAIDGSSVRTFDGRHHVGAWTVAFSPDSSRLLSCGGAGLAELFLWDVATGERLKSRRLDVRGIVVHAIYHRDGRRIIAGMHNHTIRIFDAETLNEQQVLTGHTSRVSRVALHPTEERLASGSLDGEILLWDLKTGQRTLTIKLHKSPVLGLAFSPDGKQLVSGSGDGRVVIWQSGNGM